MTMIMNDSEQQERVRQAVLNHGCSVTIGDIMSATGLGNQEAKSCLDKLISTHEGTMRVSENGELMYVFSSGCILRDQRSWWERNKKTVMKFIKGLFKIIIMLVLVIYFVIFLIILIALLCSNRNDRSGSSINFGGFWYIFWGTGSHNDYYSGNKYAKDPLYTRVYNFVFGPEEEEIDPLEARSRCAQLIRAKNGVITVEDWIMISGQSRAKCESDLARYTAEFNGSAEITDNGTLVYVFEDMMMSTKNKKESLPAPAWKNLEQPKPLSGNTEQNGGNGAVIGLNAFNLIMSIVILVGMKRFVQEAAYDPYGHPTGNVSPALLKNIDDISFWLGIFPLIFSSLIFAGPLVRLPGNRKENRERRERSIRKAVLKSILGNNNGNTTITRDQVIKSTNQILLKNALEEATPSEVNGALNEVMDELGAEMSLENSNITFANMDARLDDAQQQRHILSLDKKDMGRVVYSTDSKEQSRLDDANEKADMEEFDRMLGKSSSSRPSARPQSIDANGILNGLKNASPADYNQYGNTPNHSSSDNNHHSYF